VSNGSVPKPIVDTPQYYCQNSSPVQLTAKALPGATLNWYDTNATGGTPSSVAPTPSTSTLGKTTYYVSQTLGVCESARAAIEVNIVADTVGVLTLFCDGANSTLTTAAFDWNNVVGYLGYYYSYSVDGGPEVTGFQVSPSHFDVPVPGPGTPVRFTILSVKGLPCVPSVSRTCSSKCTTTITPTFPTFGPVCYGSTPLILPTTSTNGITGTWSPTPVSNTVSAKYIFTPDISLHPCAIPVSTDIVVTPLPNAGTISGNQNVCEGQTTKFSSTAAGGTWSSSDVLIATVNSSSGVITGVSTGTATITYTIKATNGCTIDAKADRTVTVLAAPNAGTISGNQTICSNTTTVFTTTSTGGTWSSDKPTIATVNASGLVSGVSAGTAIISYTVVGTGGCTNAIATRTVTVTAAPIIGTLSGNQNICENLTTTFTSTSTGGTWSSSQPSIATINATSGLVTGIASGTATMTYTKIGTGGCSDVSATRDVTVTKAPIAGTISGNQTICSNTTTVFSTTSTGGTWSSDKPTIATVNASGLVSGVSAGIAIISYTVVGTGGCTNAITTRTVTVTAAPIIGTLSGNQNICENLTTTFTSTSTGGTWSSIQPSIATINATSGLVKGITAGTATMTYLIKGTGGCLDVSATRDITVSSAPNAGTISGISSICQGQTTTFTTTSSGGSWSSLNANVAVIDATTGFTTTLIGGSTTIKYTVLGVGNCPNAVASKSLTVNSQTVPNFEDIFFCSGEPAPTLKTTSPNGITGTWSPAVIDNTTSGTYVFTPNTNECATLQSIQVTVNQATLKSVDWTVTSPFSENQVITVYASDAGEYLYQLDNGYKQTSNVFEFVTSGLHSITVYDTFGCSQPIIVTDILVVGYPKFFTPNGDGFNDSWNISSLSEQANSKIFIFNRYGKLLKQIDPRGNGWDGVYNGENMPSSDYWFNVEYIEGNVSKVFRSHFTLKR
jgi:gliding motility-associated-like protein